MPELCNTATVDTSPSKRSQPLAVLAIAALHAACASAPVAAVAPLPAPVASAPAKSPAPPPSEPTRLPPALQEALDAVGNVVAAGDPATADKHIAAAASAA